MEFEMDQSSEVKGMESNFIWLLKLFLKDIGIGITFFKEDQHPWERAQYLLFPM